MALLRGNALKFWLRQNQLPDRRTQLKTIREAFARSVSGDEVGGMSPPRNSQSSSTDQTAQLLKPKYSTLATAAKVKANTRREGGFHAPQTPADEALVGEQQVGGKEVAD